MHYSLLKGDQETCRSGGGSVLWRKAADTINLDALAYWYTNLVKDFWLGEKNEEKKLEKKKTKKGKKKIKKGNKKKWKLKENEIEKGKGNWRKS